MQLAFKILFLRDDLSILSLQPCEGLFSLRRFLLCSPERTIQFNQLDERLLEIRLQGGDLAFNFREFCRGRFFFLLGLLGCCKKSPVEQPVFGHGKLELFDILCAEFGDRRFLCSLLGRYHLLNLIFYGQSGLRQGLLKLLPKTGIEHVKLGQQPFNFRTKSRKCGRHSFEGTPGIWWGAGSCAHITFQTAGIITRGLQA